MRTALRALRIRLSFHTESQVRAYSVSGRGEKAQPNLDSPVDNRYKSPTCNRTGNNSEGENQASQIPPELRVSSL